MSGRIEDIEVKATTTEIDEEEWVRTPPTLKLSVARLVKELEALKKQQEELADKNQGLQEKVNRKANNSHSQPSSQLIKP